MLWDTLLGAGLLSLVMLAGCADAVLRKLSHARPIAA
jgi:hypothetical protein